MSENSNPQKNSLHEKLKNTKANRASIITAVVLVVALAVIVSVTVATNRAKKGNTPDDTDAPSVSDTVDTRPNTPDTKPADTEPDNKVNVPVDTGSASVDNKIPSFILPVSGALLKGHDSELQVYSNTLKDYRVHLGVDIVTDENAPVYAAADGTVSKIWADDMMGYCIAVKHNGNCYTIYQNLSDELPEGIGEGTKVRSGQLIATVGDSAMVEIGEEPHLHFEMTVDDLSVDPLEYFDEDSLKALSIDASYE